MRRAGAWIVWWAAFAALYLLLVDTRSLAEFSACAAAGLLGATLRELARAGGVGDLRPPSALVRSLPAQALRVPADLWLLARELIRALAGRHPAGRFHVVELQVGEGPLANGRRATIELLGSLAPNTIVLGVDERCAIVHQLSARSSERASIREMDR